MSETKTETKTSTAPKTDAPRTEIPRPQMPRIDFAGFEPWMKAATENLAALQQSIGSFWDEIATHEHAAYERARAATGDLARLAGESIAYAGQLSAEWRKLGLEATRRVTESFTRS